MDIAVVVFGYGHEHEPLRLLISRNVPVIG